MRRALIGALLLTSCAAVEPEPAPPLAPLADEPGSSAELSRAWNLIGDASTPGHDRVTLSGEPPAGADEVEIWLDGASLGSQPITEGGFSLELPLTDVAAGDHELLFALPGAQTAFARRDLHRSHPFYVVTSVDWDQADISENELAWHEQLHEQHEQLILTQLVGPYTWTDEAVSDERAAELAAWLIDMEASFGDEIGLHIHPWCSFVEFAGVTCLSEPSSVYDAGDESGYTVLASAYSEAEFSQLLQSADVLFAEAGLGKPTSFRAGGWIASASVLSALASNGYTADSSANNWRRMEEWEGRQNNVLWQWNQEHWGPIGDTSQPYYPSLADPALPGEPSIDLLEVPDNGILADYVEAEEMIEIFEANWSGGALSEPKVLSIGYHNRTMGPLFSFRGRIEGILDHLDGFLSVDDAGPVIYARLDEIPPVFAR